MTDIVEVVNKLYNRNYISFSRGMCQFGEVLTFKGVGGELTILESEMQFHIVREVDSRRIKKNYEKEGIKEESKKITAKKEMSL